MVSRPVRLPTKRPDLPRASSAMSGFFFCGMIDDPVAQASSRRAQPNSVDVQSTTSSPSRERWTPSSAAAKQNSAAKSRSLTASIELSAARSKPSSAATASGSSGSEEPASAPEPSGLTALRRSQSASRSTSRATAWAWASSWWAMSTGWACCRCVMPGARHVLVALGEPDQRVLQRRQLADQRPHVVPQVQPQVGGDLVVAAAPGAELAAQGAELLQQAALERLVHVLVGLDRRERAGGDLGGELGERADHLRDLVVGQQAGPVQHAGVRAGARQVVGRQPPVDVGRLAQRRHAPATDRLRSGRPTAGSARAGRRRLTGSAPPGSGDEVGVQFGVHGRGAPGQRAQPLGQRRAAVGLAGHHQESVVPGDGAQDVGEADLVQRRREELRGTGRRAQDGQVGAALGAGEQVGQQPGEPGRRALRRAAAARSPAART